MSATEERRRLLDERVVDLTNVSTKTVKELTNSEAVECLWGLPVRERIVRCKDCKYRFEHDFGHLYCGRRPGHCYEVSGSDFCAWGERRAND